MIAIFKREWKACFTNVTGWLFLAVNVALFGLYFYVYNLYSGSPYIATTLSATAFLMMVSVPVLTMRSFAEDRKSKVEQLILTSPVSIVKIVLAKYLATAAVFTVDILVISLAPLLLSLGGTVPAGESFVAILGYWLYGCTFIAVGMFMSSLTENQIIAAVLSFLVLFLGYMMSAVTGLLSAKMSWLARILNCYDLYAPLSKLLGGCLDLTSVVYFLGIIFLALFLTRHVIRRKHFRSKTLAFSEPIIAIALVVLCNLGIRALPTAATSLDFTYENLFEITDTTKNMLKDLKEDITIYVWANQEDADVQLRQTLKRYGDLSSHLKVEYVDPSQSPNFYQKYTETSPNKSSLFIEGQNRSKVVDYYDIYIYTYDMDYNTFQYVTNLTAYDAEGQITSAIEYVTMDSEKLPVIYTLTGHGEAEFGDHITSAVKKSNIVMEELDLFMEEKVPEDARALIINAPTSDLNKADAEKVINYMKAGGKVLLTINYEHKDLENFNSIMGVYDIKLVDGLVVENSKYYMRYGPVYLLPDISENSYTANVTGRYILAPGCTGLSYPDDVLTAAYLPLLQTTDKSVSKVGAQITTPQKEEGDIEGPFTVALAVEEKLDSKTYVQLVVVGSYVIWNDRMDDEVSGANTAFFTSIMDNMVEEVALTAGSIPQKTFTLTSIYFPPKLSLPLGIGFAVAGPILLLISGIAIWALRRRK